MQKISKLFLLWGLLTIPSIIILIRFFSESREELIAFSGEFSARLLIITLSITPLIKIFPKKKWSKYLLKHRRNFGVAAFAYALLHTIFYLSTLDSISLLLSDFSIIGIWTGWVAFFIFIPLAITSNNISMKILKKNWYNLQKTAYIAAVFTLLHWWIIHDESLEAALNFAPLLFLQFYRIGLYLLTKTKKQK